MKRGPGPATRGAARRLLRAVWCILAPCGVLGWVLYQLAPSLLGIALGARPARYAVRTETGVAMSAADGVALLAPARLLAGEQDGKVVERHGD